MQTAMTIRCSSCGQPFKANVRSLLDVENDPQGKALLLAGQLNNARCPQCGNMNMVATPVLYHDASKELLVAYVPMELNLKKDQQEKLIGDLMNQLPKTNFKGYMFSPKRALTMQGLVEQVLEKDGITPEMMQAQRARVQLAQELIEAPDDQIPAMVKQNDDKIDLQFFQTLSLLAQRMAQSGRPELAERVLIVQSVIAENSTYGQELIAQQGRQEEVVQEIADEIESMGQDATQADFLKLAIAYKDDTQRLQALVGLVRPVMDYQFFQELTAMIGQAPAAERAGLEKLRDQLTEMTQMVDQQAQARVQGAVSLLQALVSTPPEHFEEMIRGNMHMVDDTFMMVLTANIQEAERRKDVNATALLKGIYEKVVGILQETMQPELVFVNHLLSVEDDDARAMIEAEAKNYGEPLLEVMDAVGQVLVNQGQDALVERLSALRQEAAAILSQ